MVHSQGQEEKRHTLLKWLVAVIMAVLLVASPLTNSPLFGFGANTAEAASFGVIGGATTHSSFDGKKLKVWVEGGTAVAIDVNARHHIQAQFPEELGFLFKEPNIRKHMRLKYSVPAPVLGFIPIKGDIKGNELRFDLKNHVVSTSVAVPINATLIGIYKYTFEVDIEGLGVTLPGGDHKFKMFVNDEQINLGLLNFPKSRTTLSVQGDPSGGDKDPKEPPEEPGDGNDDDNGDDNGDGDGKDQKDPGDGDGKDPWDDNGDDDGLEPWDDNGGLGGGSDGGLGYGGKGGLGQTLVPTGEKLPKTATNLWTLGFTGFGALLVGILAKFFMRRRQTF